ncbi:MAG: cytochrome P450 [Acidobacteria bacterium]|nr:cytochrome P450 [Acidobacteriota bacterium]
MISALNLWAIRRDPLGFLMRVADEYGDLAYFKAGPRSVYLLNHPDYIRDVLITHNRNFVKTENMQYMKRLLGNGLVTSEGEFHLRQRRLAQPAFHRERIAGYGAMMIDRAMHMSDGWKDCETRDISREMTNLTLAITAKTLFDADVEPEADELGDALTESMYSLIRLSLPSTQIMERLMLPNPATRRFRKARERLDATIYRIIDEHRRSGEDRGDLLSMLIKARDEDGDGAGMTDEQLRDEAMTIFMAGHETVANALTFTWYLLSQHPEIEAKLVDEIGRVLQGEPPTIEAYPHLVYTEMVFAESMRLYPPAWIIARRALEDYQINGYHIPAGSILVTCPYVTHHDKRYFPYPFRFDPERWTPEAKESRPKFSYYPFGGGPRLCIGEHFAWMEGVLVLATIAQKWRLRLLAKEPVEALPVIIMRPKDGLKMKLEIR